MVHLHDEFANLGSELLVLGLQLAFAAGWSIDQGVVAILNAPPFDHASGYLMISCGLPDGGLAGFDLSDQLTFEFCFELSTNLSHYEYRAPRPRTEKIGRREGLWKMALAVEIDKGCLRRLLLDDFHQLLGKASAKNASAFPHLPQPRPLLLTTITRLAFNKPIGVY